MGKLAFEKQGSDRSHTVHTAREDHERDHMHAQQTRTQTLSKVCPDENTQKPNACCHTLFLFYGSNLKSSQKNHTERLHTLTFQNEHPKTLSTTGTTTQTSHPRTNILSSLSRFLTENCLSIQ